MGLFLGAASAAAQPSFNCEKAGSDAEELICADERLSQLDQRLAQTYKTAVSAAENLDAGADTALKNLRASQRGWIKGRDECWKADDLRTCIESSYLMREGVLVATWILQEPATIAAYSCENNPANEVTAYFFDTELPGIRLEYGDGIKTGSLVPSASGAKYMTDFGGMFWTKGDTAQFAWTEGEVMNCLRTQ
jgi:uncharacterized protein